jgi:hypothetical protein
MFGHIVSLNFNRRGNTHKTHMGGVFSFAIKGFLKIYVLLNFITMFWYEANINGYEDGSSSFEDLGRVNISDSDNVVFYVISN